MRLFRALCIVLGALLSVATLPLGSYAADALTLSEAFVLTKDGQLVDTLTITDTSGVMTDSVCTPYEGNSTDHRVEFVVRNGVSICHMQLMYTRAEDESEFTINDTGEYVLTARTDHTLTEYRKTFGDSLTTTSVSLSVEGDVLSSTAGAASSAMAYENRSFTVVTWDRSVPDVITVRGTLAAGGDRSSAGSSHALKNPWGATPLPGTNGDTSTQNPDTAASAGPSLGLLIGLIVSLIVVVLVAVFTVYAVRAKKSEEKAKPKDEAQAELSAEPRAEPSVEPGGGPNAKATSKDAEHPSSSPSMEGAASLVHARPSPLLWRTDYEPYCTPPSLSEDPMSNESGCHSRPHVPTEDSRRIEIEDPLQPNTPSPESRRNGIEPPSFPTPPASTNQGGSSADGSRFSAPGTDAPTAHLTPRETGFVWVPRSRPASSQPTPDAVPQPMKQPRRKRSRGGHRPAVFPERPVQGTTQAPNAVAPGQMRPPEGMSLRPPQGMPMQPPQGMQVRPLGAPAGSTRRSGSVTPPQPNAPWGPPSANQIRAAFPPPGGTHASSRPFDVLPHASSENSFDSPQATFSAPRQEQIVVSRTEIVSASEPAAHGFPDSETIPFPGSEALNVPGPEPVVVSDAIPLPPHEPTASAAPEADPEPYVAPQPAPEPYVAPQPAPEPYVAPQPEPEPYAAPQPAPEPYAAPQPEPEPYAAPQPEPEPYAAPQPAPEPIVTPESEPEPYVAPQPESEPHAAPQPEPEPYVVPQPAPEPIVTPEPEPTVMPESEPYVAPQPEPEPTVTPDPEPEPFIVPEPEPEPYAAPQPEPEPYAAPQPEPEPYVVPQPAPEPTVTPEPEPYVAPQPEPAPEPYAAPQPEPEPTVARQPEPAQASYSMPVEDPEPTTAQMPQIPTFSAFNWDAPQASDRVPEQQMDSDTIAPAEAPATETEPAGHYAVSQLQDFDSVIAPPQEAQQVASPAAMPPQAPPMPAAFQENWNTEFSWNDEARREQGHETKRRRWPWSRHSKKERDEETKPTLPEVDERDAATRVPIIAVDAQDDDWNGWQNWNSRG